MGLEYRPVYEGGKVAQWVRDLKGKSGVYIIRETGFVGNFLYVGESHTGRLKKTLLHHFQRWKGETAGPTFRPEGIEVAVIRTPPAKAFDLQMAIIQELSPVHNRDGKKTWLEKLIGQ